MSIDDLKLFFQIGIKLGYFTVPTANQLIKDFQLESGILISEFLIQGGYLTPEKSKTIDIHFKKLKKARTASGQPQQSEKQTTTTAPPPQPAEAPPLEKPKVELKPENKGFMKPGASSSMLQKKPTPTMGDPKTKRPLTGTDKKAESPETSAPQESKPNTEQTPSPPTVKEDTAVVAGRDGVELQEIEPPAPICDDLKVWLTKARELESSDLHLCAGSPPFVRRNRQLEFLREEPLTAEETQNMFFSSINNTQRAKLEKNKSLDYCIDVEGLGRYRGCFYKQIKGFDGVFRIISNHIRTFEELKLPPPLKRLTEFSQGLILVTGPANSGKTSTLAAMVDLINSKRDDHIISVEDPVEYVHRPKSCQVSQRELYTHTHSFGNALRGALRQDPDIIMIGEMRDRETMAMAISASETGHLVLGTMPTSSAGRTINSVVDFFPPDQQNQIRTMISESLRGIICQQLLPRADGSGVELALEILLFDTSVASLVRQNQIHQLVSAIQTGKGKGMCTLDDSLLKLLKNGLITPETAYDAAQNKEQFEAFIDSDDDDEGEDDYDPDEELE